MRIGDVSFLFDRMLVFSACLNAHNFVGVIAAEVAAVMAMKL